jgi:nitrite reductase/ring-hydroxylating ferredoxin subunit
MSALQTNSKDFNPNTLNLVRVATYDRVIGAPLVRAWENVLDWEHLPYLHETSFDYVELEVAGDWGWRTWSNAEHTDHVELSLANGDSYVARSYVAGKQVSEIWTTLIAEDEKTKVHVEFHFPDIKADKVEKMSSAILSLYTKLWDEDEAMMQQRHARLRELRDDQTEVDLGEVSALKNRINAGDDITFQLKKREYQLRQKDGEWLTHSTICPHLLGPLTDADLSMGKLRCPWHGYEFDLRSGECTFPPNAGCELPKAPELTLINGNIIARL